MIRNRSARTRTLVLALLLPTLGNLSVAGQEKAPRQKTGGMFPGMGVAQPDDFRAYHFVDAVVAGGSVRADLSGLHVGPVKRESSARGAADHLADELERFCKQNHAALTRVRTETRPNEP